MLSVLPAAVAAPPSLLVAKLPPVYSHGMKLLRHRLKEKVSPFMRQLQQVTILQLLQFPDLRLVQYDAGRGELLLGVGVRVFLSPISKNCARKLYPFLLSKM